MTDKTSRMPLPDGLTEEAILAAIADYRVRGSREAFLEHHGIRKGATSYFICYEGDCYDLKAIARVSLGRPQGRIGKSSEVAREIRCLGLEGLRVVHRPLK